MGVEIVLLREPKRGLLGRGEKFFMTGFHGVGIVGYFTSYYMVEQDGSEYIGYVKTDKMPLTVRMKDDRIALPMELYERGDFVILLNEILPGAENIHEYVKSVAEWVVDSGFSEAVLIGGLLTNYVGDTWLPFRIAHTTAYLKKGRLRDLILEGKFLKIDSDLQIYGPLALMLAHFQLMNFPAIAVLPLSSHRYQLDINAVRTALSFLNEHYNAQIDLQAIDELAEKMKRAEQEVEEKAKSEEVFRPPKREDFMFYM